MKGWLGKRDNGSLDYQQSQKLPPIKLPASQASADFVPLYETPAVGQNTLDLKKWIRVAVSATRTTQNPTLIHFLTYRESPMQKQALLYTGKAKSVYETDDADYLIMHFS